MNIGFIESQEISAIHYRSTDQDGRSKDWVLWRDHFVNPNLIKCQHAEGKRSLPIRGPQWSENSTQSPRVGS